jgi:hypothetical protein
LILYVVIFLNTLWFYFTIKNSPSTGSSQLQTVSPASPQDALEKNIVGRGDLAAAKSTMKREGGVDFEGELVVESKIDVGMRWSWRWGWVRMRL